MSDASIILNRTGIFFVCLDFDKKKDSIPNLSGLLFDCLFVYEKPTVFWNNLMTFLSREVTNEGCDLHF